jgi:hypothetical protein
MSQINPVHVLPTDLRSTLMLSSPFHLRLTLPNGLFPSGLPTKSLRAPPLPLIRPICQNISLFVSFDHPHNTGWGVQILKLLFVYLSPLPCNPVPLRSKYPSQHLILEHSQPTFLPQCERSSFTPIQNSKQNYTCVEDMTHINSVLEFCLQYWSHKALRLINTFEFNRDRVP